MNPDMHLQAVRLPLNLPDLASPYVTLDLLA